MTKKKLTEQDIAWAKIIGARVKELRHLSKIAASKMAQQCDCTSENLLQMERGEHMSIYLLRRVACVLGMPIAAFLDETNTHENRTSHTHYD